jgi:hypothetical protein
MNKITADHLARRACVYIRQSTPEQVRHNLESKRRQYGLVDRARALGWQEIDVIDDDLGISGSGIRRPGFERLLAAVCDGQVGAVFSIEASRPARTNREWHTLLEFCSIVGVLLIDAEAVYDPRLTNDRLLSGRAAGEICPILDKNRPPPPENDVCPSFQPNAGAFLRRWTRIRPKQKLPRSGIGRSRTRVRNTG